MNASSRRGSLAACQAAWQAAWQCSALVWFLAAWLSGSSSAHADSALDVANSLNGLSLGSRLELLEDVTGALTIDDVQGAASTRFVRCREDAPNFGYSSSIYWAKLTVHNASGSTRPWLLELAYPHIDQLTLYEPLGDRRFRARTTGDMHPFAQRDLAYRNFVFTLEEPARALRTYYLRVETTGPVSLPLVAWTMKEFIEHQHLDWAALCMFYGVVLVMVAYNALVYAFTRKREYLPYVGFILSLGTLQFTLAGHSLQFLLPHDPLLVHQLLPASLATTLLFACLVVTSYVPREATHLRMWRMFAWYFGTWATLSFILPYTISIRMLVLSAALPMLDSALLANTLFCSGAKQARVFMVSWGSTVVGTAVYIGQTLAFIPTTYATVWTIQVGLSIQLVLISSALAGKINSARRALTAVNEQLSTKVDALSAALSQAEEATQRAQRATRVKDDFMATMSHEFRTPLNPIINIPQGILEEFVRTRYAVCSRCQSNFELEPSEFIVDDTPCPDCRTRGALIERVITRFTGDPLRARRFLQKVERSGAHLLRVVNGILDFSKMEAGHLKLVRVRFDLTQLAQELCDELNREANEPRVRMAEGGAGVHCKVEADPERLRQVLTQLIDNGLKFSDSPKPVTVRVASIDEGCLVEVADEGIGIASEFRESIFESFEQVDKGNTRKYGGAGIGLSISRSLVRMHGGEMWVESELGRGSKFYFLVPLAAAAPSVLPRSA